MCISAQVSGLVRACVHPCAHACVTVSVVGVFLLDMCCGCYRASITFVIYVDVGEWQRNFLLRRDGQRDTRERRRDGHSEGRDYPHSNVPPGPTHTKRCSVSNFPTL